MLGWKGWWSVSVERSTSPSKTEPGKLDVFITGDSLTEVQGDIFTLEYDWQRLEFTLPVKDADGRWAVKGRVWNLT